MFRTATTSARKGETVAYDLVIRNGTVIDGSGRPRYRADVGVIGDRVATIGRIRELGLAEIDAEDHFVTPGFVDGHTHLDAQVCWDPLGTSASWHGVTSAVMGNCGFTLAPCPASQKDLALRNLERAEDMSRDALLAGIEWTWETFPDYLDVIERLPKGINYASYIGHSALRTYVMGARAFEEPSSDDDIAAMRGHVEAALRAGAIGLSTSRSPNHATSDDRPVASRLATWDEVRLLVGVMGDLGAGIFELANEVHADPAATLEYHDRLRGLTIESRRPLTFVCGAPRPGGHRPFLDLLERSAAEGGRMVGQVHSREFMSIMGFRVNLPFDKLPGWSELRRQDLAGQEASLRDPDTRRRLVDEAMSGHFGPAIGAEVRPPQYDEIRVLHAADGPYRTVAELALERGTTPVDVMIDLSLDAGFDQYFAQPFANRDLDDVLEMIRHPNTVVAVSDTGAHVSQIIDSSIPTFLLGYWARDRQALTWEEAVRMLTFDPASLWGLRDRGLLREGSAADIVVFDPERVGPDLPEADHDLPAGAVRLKQRAIGIKATVVNGEVLMRDGAHTGALPGRLLRQRVGG
jgi:N-acyl-D-amino-acid deacylase